MKNYPWERRLAGAEKQTIKSKARLNPNDLTPRNLHKTRRDIAALQVQLKIVTQIAVQTSDALCAMSAVLQAGGFSVSKVRRRAK